MKNDDDVFEVQRLYPQIYLACHKDHVRAVSTKWRISSQDASILVHLDRETGLSPRALAAHLGVAASTLSAALTRLAKLGYLANTPNESDRRKRELRLTARGAEAIANTLVLDAERVLSMLSQLKPEERKDAVRGVGAVGEGCEKCERGREGMKTIIFVLIGIVVALVLVVGVVALIGSQLPKTHVATRSILLHRSPQDVYSVVRDFGSAPKWRADVKHVDVEAGSGGPVLFREDGANGLINYELIEDVPGERMVTKIRDTDLGYSGQWTYTFAAENSGTRVTIREDGEVSNVLFRFMSRYVFGHTATMDAYLKSLAKHFGEDAPLQTL